MEILIGIGIIVALTIICFTMYECKRLKLEFESPQAKCNHKIETKEIWRFKYDIQYLSTCEKCGYQRKHYCSFTN